MRQALEEVCFILLSKDFYLSINHRDKSNGSTCSVVLSHLYPIPCKNLWSSVYLDSCIMFWLTPKLLALLQYLTHLSLASLLWDIGKQNSPRCDAA